MEIHQVPQLPGLLQLLLVGAVDELPGEVDPVAQVVTEKSVTIMTRPDNYDTSYSTVQYCTIKCSTVPDSPAPTPLPSLRGGLALSPGVATAFRQIA